MHVDYPGLLSQAVFEKKLTLIDASVVFLSSNEDLVNFAADEISPILPEGDTRLCHEFHCVIETRAAIEAMSFDLPGFDSSEGKYINPPELGHARIFQEKGQVAIALQNLGTLYHSGAGDFVIQVEYDSLRSEDGKKLNLLELLNLFISEALLLTDRLLIHSGCVGTKSSCELWTGDSGAGKTTRILNLVGSGYLFFGDDQVIIGRGEGGTWQAWPFWRPLRVKPDSMDHLKHLSFMSCDTGCSEEKMIFNDIQSRLNMHKPRPAPITAINNLVPGNENIFELLGQEQAFQAVANGFLHSLLPGSMITALDMVLELLEDVPVRSISWDRLGEYDKLRLDEKQE